MTITDRMPTVCILAGGRGTRLRGQVRTIPKPMLSVAGRPFLLHQLELLARHGVERVVLCVGYLGEQIEQGVGSSRYGLEIAYSYDSPGLDGTLGAVLRAAPLLGQRFLILYGDTYLRIDYAAANQAWLATRLPAMMTVLENAGRWDVSNAEFDGRLVTAYDKVSPTPKMRWIDYGLGGLTADCLTLSEPEEHDLAMLYRRLAARGELFGFAAIERFYEIGTPAALRETEMFLDSGGGNPAVS